ncbi:unnamed protein product [Ilex paraguariensis]|uniref:Uncharacterized protein n=1 Tax=Ilex paraguariensis TaxID=185542 RepID=A0ABC8RQ25_9AQUA
MESWVPLFDIFLNSPCPETEASLWLQQSFNPSSTTTISTNSFLSLLTKPADAIVVDSSFPSPSQSSHTNRVTWIRTVPNAVQARILSFLAFEHRRFGTQDLSKLATDMLSESDELDFWVKRAARQLLDVVSDSNYEWVSCLNMDSEQEKVDDDFGSLPDWLKDAANTSDLVLPWLPISPDRLNLRISFSSSGGNEDSLIEVEEDVQEGSDEVMTDVDVVNPKNDPIHPEVEKKASSLKAVY